MSDERDGKGAIYIIKRIKSNVLRFRQQTKILFFKF